MNPPPSRELESGVLRAELFMGIVSAVAAGQAQMTVASAAAPSASHFESRRYGRGEVGEFVLVEGQTGLVLGRIVDVGLRDAERKNLTTDQRGRPLDVIGTVQFLGTVTVDTLRVAPGIATYPRIGDRVYAAPHEFVARIPRLQDGTPQQALTLALGVVRGAGEATVEVRPEKLFGRHCAVLGATGGGKSWTVGRIVEEVMQHRSKVLLLDATSEYRTVASAGARHYHLGAPVHTAIESVRISLPANGFQESDFIALFEPAGKLQGPKLREAIRSLRLVHLVPSCGPEGVLRKENAEKAPIEDLFRRNAALLEDPATPFDVSKLARQLIQECVSPTPYGRSDSAVWGGVSSSDQTSCLPLAARIHSIVRSTAFEPVFGSPGRTFADCLRECLDDSEVKLMRVCLGGVSHEFRAREFIVNALGRAVLNEARAGRFAASPLLVVLDEAHNFLGRAIGNEDGRVDLNAFELIAREGRKYGLNICLATQRPRDLTEGVLSQIGTLVVHRLTNDRDREVVERACGEIDRSAAAFLSSLRSGEAVIIGVDFPIPLTVQIRRPTIQPASDGPDYQKAWRSLDAAARPPSNALHAPLAERHAERDAAPKPARNSSKAKRKPRL